MSRWIVLATPLSGMSDTARDTKVLRELTGTAEEAAHTLLEQAHTFDGRVWKVSRREVFRHTDRSVYLRLTGRFSTFGYLLQLAELVSDSAAPSATAP
ncbi:hypothetical protein [Streptomyces subrutilus]|uniref:hypothetical protein n=1 Tax=Streptomyces subrutilus TaxID=36818 RepID=UPI002E1242B9|nr:hypothetical protein OG479_32555 [Streptomyces subrutilus]